MFLATWKGSWSFQIIHSLVNMAQNPASTSCPPPPTCTTRPLPALWPPDLSTVISTLDDFEQWC
jgi:hypothetical protein